MVKDKSFFGKHKVLTIIGGIVAILVLIGIGLFNNPPDALVEWVFKFAMDQSLGKNTFDDDALYAITTGTGGPLAEAGRAGPQTVVIAGDEVLVFDAGPGSTRQFTLSGISVGSVDALFLTHFHSDHIGDVGELMLQRWTSEGAAVPLPVYGPPGIDTVIEGFKHAYTLDKGYRVAHHGEEAMPSSGFGAEVHAFNLGSDLMSSETVYQNGDVEVIAFNVDHMPVFPAVGYRVNYKERSLVITGDTVYTESLVHHSMKADLLISEALNHEYSQMISDASTEKDNNLSIVAKDIKTYHIRPDEVGIVARDADVSYLLVTHILPPIPAKILKNGFLRDTKEIYKGDVYLANDGTMIKMPVGSDEITVHELLR